MTGGGLAALAALVVLFVSLWNAARWRSRGDDARPVPQPRPMTPGRFVGYVLLGCITVFVLFPLLVIVVLAGLAGL